MEWAFVLADPLLFYMILHFKMHVYGRLWFPKASFVVECGG